MDIHHLVIDPGLRSRTSTLPGALPDDGDGELLPEAAGSASGAPGDALEAAPASASDGARRRRGRLLAGVALGVVLLAAGGAFVVSPYNTLYPLNLDGTATKLRGAVETARQTIMPVQPAPDLIAPAARIATAPDPLPVPPVQREAPVHQPAEEQVQEIIGLQAPPASPAARVAEPMPLARRLGEPPRRADTGTGASRAATPPVVSLPAVSPAAQGTTAAPPGPPPLAAAVPPEETATAMAAMPSTSPPAAARPARPPVAPVPAAVEGNLSGASAPDAPRPASAPPGLPAAEGITLPAPLVVTPVPAPAAMAPQGIASDPLAIAAHLRPAPMSTPQQVEVLGLVTAIGTMVRDLREENRQLRADMAAARGRIEETTADLSRRVALAEARGAVAGALSGLAPSGPPGAAEPQAVAVPAGERAAGNNATPAASRGAGAAPRADDVRRRYRVQAASPGLAMLSEVDNSSESGVQLQVAVGDQVPGYGRITAIAQQGATWVVRTERGNIQ